MTTNNAEENKYAPPFGSILLLQARHSLARPEGGTADGNDCRHDNRFCNPLSECEEARESMDHLLEPAACGCFFANSASTEEPCCDPDTISVPSHWVNCKRTKLSQRF